MEDKIQFLQTWMENVELSSSRAEIDAAGEQGPQELKSFVDSTDFFIEESNKASKGGAYLAACVMRAAAVEAGLLALAFLHQDEVFASKIFNERKFRRDANSVSELSLAELIELSNKLGWISPDLIAKKISSVIDKHSVLLRELLYGDAAKGYLPSDPTQAILRFLNKMRNSLHAGRFAQMDRNPNDPSLRDACHVAYLLSTEILECIAVKLHQDGSRARKFLAPSPK